MSAGNLTEALIHFALNTKYEDIPENVIETQKKSLLDSIGVMSAATTLEPACAPFIYYAAENSVERTCTIIGTGIKASAVLAAMANGVLIHALDYEDGHDPSKTHPNTASIPTMIALSECMKISGKKMLAAMAVSSEIACRLKQSLLINDLEYGWYSPPMFSAYGAVFGGAGILGFDEAQTLDAISICMTQVMLPGQCACSKASVLRAIRDAFSAKAAVFSLHMAENGVHARMDEPLEGPYGLFKMLAHGKYSPEFILHDLGKRWECEKLRYKAWPCCGTIHGALDTLLGILRQYNIHWSEINRIYLTVNPIHLRVLEPYDVKYAPGSLAAAKFSMPFVLAVAALYGDVRLEMFNEENLHSDVVRQLAKKVTYKVRQNQLTNVSGDFGDDHVSVVLDTKKGVFEQESFVSLGAPTKPLSRQQMTDKFLDCVKFSRYSYDDKIPVILESIHEFNQITDAGKFFNDNFST